jgi:hypothetical protein
MTDQPLEPFGNPDFVPQSEHGCDTSGINVFNRSTTKKLPPRNNVRLIAVGESDLLQSDDQNNDTYLS